MLYLPYPRSRGGALNFREAELLFESCKLPNAQQVFLTVMDIRKPCRPSTENMSFPKFVPRQICYIYVVHVSSPIWRRNILQDFFALKRRDGWGAYGTSTEQIRLSVAQLEKVGLVKVSLEGLAKLASLNNSIYDLEGIPDSTLALLFDQMFMKSIRSKKKVNYGLFLAIPSARIPQAMKLMNKFRNQFEDIMQRPGKKDAMFYLGMTFFHLLNLKSEKN
jgi:hypothetical protein